jgi:hypothetical protein
MRLKNIKPLSIFLFLVIQQQMQAQDYTYSVLEAKTSTYNIEFDVPEVDRTHFYLKGTIDSLLVDEHHHIEMTHIKATDNNGNRLRYARPFIDKNYKWKNEISLLFIRNKDSSNYIQDLDIQLDYTTLSSKRETYYISDFVNRYGQNLLENFSNSIAIHPITVPEFDALQKKTYKKKLKAYKKARRRSKLSKEEFDAKYEMHLFMIELYNTPLENGGKPFLITDPLDEIENIIIYNAEGESMIQETSNTQNRSVFYFYEAIQPDWTMEVIIHKKLKTEIIHCKATTIKPTNH